MVESHETRNQKNSAGPGRDVFLNFCLNPVLQCWGSGIFKLDPGSEFFYP
jgi:hypothetical protein